MGDGRWVGDGVRVSEVCGAYLGGGAGWNRDECWF